MEINTKICLLVCAFAMAREFRPLEPFFAEFLIGPDVGFSEKQAVQDIFVIWAYSSFFLVILVFLITDFVRYKPIIIADGVAGIMTYVLLLGKPSVRMMQIEQMFYSFFFSSDTAYYTYMYAKIEDKMTYNRITGYVRACVLFGKFVSGCLSQLYVTIQHAGINASKLPLVYLSIGGMSVATFISLLLPPVKHTFYFHRKKTEGDSAMENPNAISVSTIQIWSPDASDQPQPVKAVLSNSTPEIVEKSNGKYSTALKYFWSDFKCSFSNQKVIVWAFWWSVAGAGSNLVLSYCQVIWKQVIEENYPDVESKNGIVDCIYTALSAAASYKVGQLNVEWTRHSNALLTIGSLCLGVLVLFTSQLKNIYLLYGCHILFGLAYNTMLTVAEFEIAKQVKESCYGLVFGFIQFVTIAFTALWTMVIVEDTFFTFNIQRQFEFCALYFLAIGIYYLLRTIQYSIWGKDELK
ncbi:folate transporter 1 isoform X2 [Bemisia tabaci]|uniref:folate transporter 1 isoform X2 n=1 Tax=Bemisia tabaci TaxID=7038 RepID=UPI0008F9A4DE|nr:PREDICTED: folate transporter 1-like isoform X2 [Bemisia tabaci]